MELLIPLVLGGLFVVANRSTSSTPLAAGTSTNNNNNIQESFASVKTAAPLVSTANVYGRTETLPNPDPTFNEYPNANQATDKYFDQGQIQQVNPYPPVDLERYAHNNMQPFNGRKVRGQLYDNTNLQAETKLDAWVGGGSQYVEKVERAPLFAPENNVQNVFGNANHTDFYRSRQNPSMRNANVKPFETIQVGPGLGKGYSADGSGGFNSGMEDRQAWMPKTVDELRVASNPKTEYQLLGLESPAQALIQNAVTSQQMGAVEHYRPDRFFVNTQDRWFTTTGQEKGETLRSIADAGNVRRCDSATDYTGPLGNAEGGTASYAPSQAEPSRRTELSVSHYTAPASALGRTDGTDLQGRQQSHVKRMTQRSHCDQPDTFRSGFAKAMGAALAPFTDALRWTRKDDTVTNVRVYGDGGSVVPQGYMQPSSGLAPTIRDTTLCASEFRINNQGTATYVNTQSPLADTERDSTSCLYYASGGANYGPRDTVSAYQQHNNDKLAQTAVGFTPAGGTQMFNQTTCLTSLRSDTSCMDGHVNPGFSAVGSMPPSLETYGYTQHSPQLPVNDNRLQPDLLQAFMDNPYTHSLTHCV